MKFVFGGTTRSKEKMIINAETIEEAKTEFAFSCADISQYSIKGNPIGSKILLEPYGFTDGKPNNEYILPNFYQRINISIEEKDEKGYLTYQTVGIITVQEIEVILATPQHHLLSTKASSDSIVGETESQAETRPSRGIQLLKQQSRAVQLSFRNKQLELIGLKAESALQLSKYDKIRRESEKEQRKIEEKINILQTYSGIGKDLVKIRSGNPSKSKKITVFQGFRYMREDIELLSDFEDFDYTSIEAFDAFLAERYKELLPVDLSIQAFKISKFPILYETTNLFGEKIAKTNKENEKIFILIRNGDNVYRMFNQYRFNGKLFHSENELDGLIKKEGAFAPSKIDEMEGGATAHWYIEGESEQGYTTRKSFPIAHAFYPILCSTCT